MNTLRFIARSTGPAHARAQRGTSLVEILVAVLILSIGFVALLGVRTASLRYSKAAEFRTAAALLAEDYADKMRANAQGARNGNYIYTTTYSADAALPEVPPLAMCATGACNVATAAAVAAQDQAIWLRSARGLLPGAGLWATRPAGAGAGSEVMDVWVIWQEAQGSAAEGDGEDQINAAYACPDASGAPAEARCLHYRITL